MQVQTVKVLDTCNKLVPKKVITYAFHELGIKPMFVALKQVDVDEVNDYLYTNEGNPIRKEV